MKCKTMKHGNIGLQCMMLAFIFTVCFSSWHHTDSGKWVGFRARSVIGGYWMKVLMDKVQNNQ